MTPDQPSWRKPVGALAILGLIIVWVAMVASLSGFVGGWHWVFQLLFYLVTGIVWIVPMGPVLKWMERE